MAWYRHDARKGCWVLTAQEIVKQGRHKVVEVYGSTVEPDSLWVNA